VEISFGNAPRPEFAPVNLDGARGCIPPSGDRPPVGVEEGGAGCQKGARTLPPSTGEASDIFSAAHPAGGHPPAAGDPTGRALRVGVGSPRGLRSESSGERCRFFDENEQLCAAKGSQGPRSGPNPCLQVAPPPGDFREIPTDAECSLDSPNKLADVKRFSGANRATFETIRQNTFGTLDTPRCCNASCKPGREHERDTKIFDTQTEGVHDSVRGPIAETTDSTEGAGENISSHSSSNVNKSQNVEHASAVDTTDKERTILLWSTLGLGSGPVQRGLGLDPFSPVFEVREAPCLHLLSQPLSFISIDSTTSSSQNVASQASIDGVRIRSPSDRSNRALAPITDNILNTRVVLSWDSENEFSPVAPFLSNFSLFENLFIPNSQRRAIRRRIRRSKVSLDNKNRLLNFGTIEPVTWEECVQMMSTFQVPKKGNEDRFVCDGSPLNSTQSKPPPANIPKFHVLLQTLMKHKFIFTCDAVSYFYQFILEDPLIRNYFCMAFNQPRGRPLLFRLRRMCMGWKFSPCIAQRCANVIVRESLRRARSAGIVCSGFVWIDNFIFGADTFDDASSLLDIFLTVARECNLLLHPPSEISTTAELLGVIVCTSSGTIRHCTKFVTAVRNLHSSLTSQSSLREVSKFLGHLIWTCYTRSLPLCLFPEVIEFIRSTHALICQGVSWDAPSHLDTARLCNRVESLVDTCAGAFVLTKPSAAPWYEVFSDAMVQGELATWAYTSGDHVAQGTFEFTSHIFIHELCAAATALHDAAAKNPRGNCMLLVDNTAVLFALRAGHSGNVWADTILSDLFRQLPFSFNFKVAHVTSAFNAADPFTRGLIGSSGVWATSNWG